MNGRTYDYNLGRFLSVDPYIQFPSNSQSLNPYSYLMNNPFSGTDPSGYMAENDDKVVSVEIEQKRVAISQKGSRIKKSGVQETLTGTTESGDTFTISAGAEGFSFSGLPSNSGGEGRTTRQQSSSQTPSSIDPSKQPIMLAQSGQMSEEDKCDLVPHTCTGMKDIQKLQQDISDGADTVDNIATSIVEETTNPINYAPVGRALKVLGNAQKLPKHLRNKLKRIKNQTAAGGNTGISGSVSNNDALKLGEAFVGEGFKISRTGNGAVVYISADGLRQFRTPSVKKGINPNTEEPFSNTGVQVNFESRSIAKGRFESNVHLDVDG